MTAYARHSDGTLVPEGQPVSNGWLARAWRLPSALLPVGTSGWIVRGVSFAALGLVVGAVLKAARKLNL